jgi:hypothetical protein
VAGSRDFITICYNENSDIYSLAVTICEMANGMVPPTDSLTPQGWGTLWVPYLLCLKQQAVLASIPPPGHSVLRLTSAQDLLGFQSIKQLRKTNTTLLTLIHPIQYSL